MKTERKSFRLELKSVDDAGIFEGYCSTFGNEDLDGDVVVKGAFKRSIDSGRKIPILWQHQEKEPIGLSLELKEDDHGLFTRGQLAIDTELGARAFSLLKLGALDSLSIGYQVIQQERKNNVRYLKEIKLFEYSVVTFPANPEATVDTIKAASAAAKGAAMDFNEALQVQQTREDLYEQRWTIQSALSDSIDSILDDKTLDKDAKKKAVKEALHQYADAMADLQAKMIDALPDEGDDDGSKAAKTPAAPGAAAMMHHMKGMQRCSEAMAAMQKAMMMHQKGIDTARLEGYSAISAAGDKTPPAASGGKSNASLLSIDTSRAIFLLKSESKLTNDQIREAREIVANTDLKAAKDAVLKLKSGLRLSIENIHEVPSDPEDLHSLTSLLDSARASLK